MRFVKGLILMACVGVLSFTSLFAEGCEREEGQEGVCPVTGCGSASE